MFGPMPIRFVITTFSLLFAIHSGAAETESSKWFYTEGRPKAVGLVLHGLNLKPSRMDSISAFLASNGYDLYRLKLRGHGDSLGDFKNVSREEWLREMSSGVAAVQARAKLLKVPTFVVGYSVGALVYFDLKAWDSEMNLGPQILFAPALTPRSRNKLIFPFKIFGKGFCIPSLSPRAYRANGCTPIAAYNALFESSGFLSGTGFERLNEPSILFVDPRDELVSATNLKKAVAGPLNRWTVFEVGIQESTLPTAYHHLIIDEASVGARLWRTIQTKMLSHLSETL
ncbi:MAG: alpha/beta hydrolase [Bdellovibrionia bacterium]